jgi:hypothetical protein
VHLPFPSPLGFLIPFIPAKFSSRKHPTARRLAPAPRLLPHHVHFITSLDKSFGVGRQSGDGLRLLHIWSRDEFPLLQAAGVFEEFVLQGMIDVFLDNDEFIIAL